MTTDFYIFIHGTGVNIVICRIMNSISSSWKTLDIKCWTDDRWTRLRRPAYFLFPSPPRSRRRPLHQEIIASLSRGSWRANVEREEKVGGEVMLVAQHVDLDRFSWPASHEWGEERERERKSRTRDAIGTLSIDCFDWPLQARTPPLIRLTMSEAGGWRARRQLKTHAHSPEKVVGNWNPLFGFDADAILSVRHRSDHHHWLSIQGLVCSSSLVSSVLCQSFHSFIAFCLHVLHYLPNIFHPRSSPIVLSRYFSLQ
jgi:hypothetical protein